MNKKRPAIDGFIPRKPGDRLGSLHNIKPIKRSNVNISDSRPLHTASGDTLRKLGKQKEGYGLGRSDIDESLIKIDSLDSQNQYENDKKISFLKRRRLSRLNKKPQNRFRKFIKLLVILIVLSVLGAGSYTLYKIVNAGDNVFNGNIMDIFKTKELKQDENGRSNFLLVGTSEDDPNHGGAFLTDSILIVSVDQKNKNMYMFSVPRDLYVEYGMACNSGYAGKINEYFICSNGGETKEDEQDRLIKTQEFIGDIFGLDIQYGVHVNHTVIKEVVDAIGGIDVDIQGSNGDPGILDRNFDWRCNYTCYLVKYDNGINHLDGEHALFLAMARGDVSPTYGLANSNFDREKNQQKIMSSIKEKAMTTGILTNLSAVTKMIDALGDNLRTNIATDEIQTLMKLASDIKSSDVHTISLVDKNNPVMSTGMYGGSSVVMPKAGIYDYSEIQALIAKNFSSDPLIRESAPIVVLNGSGQVGLAQSEADKLSLSGFTISSIDNAPSGTYEEVEIYQIGNGNIATANKLTETFKVTIKTTAPPVTVDEDVKFVIIFGAITKEVE